MCRRTRRSWARPRRGLGPPLGVVEEDEVEVAVVIELAAAELSDAEDRQPRFVAGVVAMRRAEPIDPSAILVAGDVRHDPLGHVAQLARHRANRFAPEDVSGPDPHPFLVTKTGENGGQVPPWPWQSSASQGVIAEDAG